MERCKSNCDIYKKEQLSTISNNSISKRKHRVPLMGKTVLLAKHADVTVLQHVNESDIITKLVLERFKNVLDYYRQRSSRRSRHREDTRILTKNIMEEKADEIPTGTFTHEDQILVVEASPVLAKIVEESSSEDDHQLEEKVDYDPQQFLFDALGGELHDYHSNTDVQSNPVNYNNDDCSIGTSNISTLMSKSNSSYSLFSRKMRRCNTYASSTMYDKINDNGSLHTEDNKATQYVNEAATQHHVIIQASKALNLCLSCKEFRSSLEYVEAEKILLLAIERREAVLRELRLIEYEDVTEDCCCLGHITISNLAFHLIHSSNLKANLITQWFFAILSCGPHVFATEIVKPDDQNQISFKMYFTFHSLSSDFEILIKLYYLNILNAKRYSRELVRSDTTMCPSPNNLLGFYKKSDTRHKRLYSYERREPSFTLYGATKILISDLPRSTFKLTNASHYSEPLGNVNLKLSSSIKFSLTYSGFLTIGSEAGGLAIWNRRWCLLDGRLLKYWSYPQEQEFIEPVNIIDLSYCVISSISKAHRELCARPRTLVIETGRKSTSDDANTLMIFCKSSYTITRHYLSADSVEEMEVWEKLLNSVLSSLRNWNCMDCPLNFNN